MKIDWVNILHIYQPAWQDPDTVKRVADESYSFLISTFKKFKNYRGTISIAGTLLETLHELGYHKLIDDVNSLISNGQIELTGSSHYHAFLPQLPEKEIERQIMLQEEAIKKYCNGYKPCGFFLPEMAYSPTVGSIIKSMGYDWIVLDPISTKTKIDPSIKYRDRRTGLTIIFRNRLLSKSYPPEEIYKLLNNKKDRLIITATDGEMYGHFHKDWQDHLKQILESEQIKSIKVSEYIERLKEVQPIQLRSASWETKAKQIKKNNPFSIWYNKSNPIHKRLWQLAHMAMKEVENHKQDPNYYWARLHLDRGLASCSWWWASEVKTSAFAPLAWSPDEILKGATELIKSIRSINTLSAAKKIQTEKIYLSLQEKTWTKHWNTYGNKS